MLKLFIKLMIFVLILAVAGPFIMRGPDGRPLLSLADIKLPDFSLALPKLGSTAEPPPAEAPGSGQWIQWSDKASAPFNPDVLTREQLALLDIKAQDNIFYRWKDPKGVWQFSAVPNRNTLNHVVRTDPNANVLQSLSTDDIDRAFGRTPASETGNSITQNNPAAGGKEAEPSLLPIPTTVPVAEIPKLLDQAKDVQRIMEQRMQKMDQALK